LYEGVVRSLNNPDSNSRSTPRSRRSSSQFLRPQVTGVTAVTSLSSDKIPLLHLKRKVGNTWEYSSNLTGVYLDALTVVPFNQASKQDVEALIDYIYASLSMDLDYILPFAGIPENGREIDGLDDKSELAHRMMLVNLLRILGAVNNKKASRHFVTRPTQVILPLSPNHGLFGNDGLYSESKISLETLFQRWASESWGEYLFLAGAVIG
jgi:3-oxoacyl-ACP reductase-like protein